MFKKQIEQINKEDIVKNLYSFSNNSEYFDLSLYCFLLFIESIIFNFSSSDKKLSRHIFNYYKSFFQIIFI